MLKTFTLIFFVIVYFGAIAQNNPLVKYQKKAKQAYRNYVATGLHKTIKASKNTNSYNIGDQRNFWRYDFTNMPPQDIEVPATCRAVGEHSYVFVEDAASGTSMTQADVDEVLFRLEDETLLSSQMGIVEMDTTYFGPIPDELDNDQKVIFFYAELGSYNGSVFDGYFSAYNQMTDAASMATSNRHSNECEMLYMSCNPVDPTSTASMSVLSHELQHLIHFGIDPFEETWVDEACAEYAMVLYGAPDPLTGFPTEPNDNLIHWGQAWSDYVQSMMFFVYLSEHYGGAPFIKEIVMNQGISYTGINNVLSNNAYTETFLDIFKDWTNANYIDAPDLDAGKYNYDVFNIPPFYLEHVFSTNNQVSTSLQSCAAHYMSVPTDFNTVNITLTPTQAANWDINLIAYENTIAKEIISSSNGENLNFDRPISYNLTKLILVIRNNDLVNDDSEKDYSILVSGITTEINNINTNITNTQVFPNPFNSTVNISFYLEDNVNTFVGVYDNTGKLIKQLCKEELVQGEHYYSWNAKNNAEGVYFVKIITDKYTTNKKCVLVK